MADMRSAFQILIMFDVKRPQIHVTVFVGDMAVFESL
jgi:hypothetical protein